MNKHKRLKNVYYSYYDWNTKKKNSTGVCIGRHSENRDHHEIHLTLPQAKSLMNFIKKSIPKR